MRSSIYLSPLFVPSALSFSFFFSSSLSTNATFTCPAVHIIVARASTELPGTGIIGTLAALVAKDNNDTTVEPIEYPATLQNYPSSSAQGTNAMITSLENIVQACGNNGTKVVLMGYSQGAQVVGDTMCGGGGIGAGSPVNQKIADQYSGRGAFESKPLALPSRNQGNNTNTHKQSLQ